MVPNCEKSIILLNKRRLSLLFIATFKRSIMLRYNLDRSSNASGPFAFFLVVGGLLAFVLVTMITVGASGYESVVIGSSDFDLSIAIWYDIFVPPSMRSRHRNCTPAVITLDNRIVLLLCH